MPYKLPGSMQYLWSKISLQIAEKKKTIVIFISMKRYFPHPEKSFLSLSLFLNFKAAL